MSGDGLDARVAAGNGWVRCAGILLFSLCFACGGGKSAEEAEAERFPADKLPGIAERYRAPEGPRDVQAPAKEFPGRAAYNQAKEAVFSGNLELAIQNLDQAISENPEFAEAWYQRGASKANLAIQRVEYDESAARDLFRDAVSDKRQAQSLFDANSFFVWTPSQQEEARSDLANGLADVDELLSDDDRLTMVLRMYAGGAR